MSQHIQLIPVALDQGAEKDEQIWNILQHTHTPTTYKLVHRTGCMTKIPLGKEKGHPQAFCSSTTVSDISLAKQSGMDVCFQNFMFFRLLIFSDGILLMSCVSLFLKISLCLRSDHPGLDESPSTGVVVLLVLRSYCEGVMGQLQHHKPRQLN